MAGKVARGLAAAVIVTAGLALVPEFAAGVAPSGTADRTAGPDRVTTAIEISKRLPLGPTYAVLARSDNFPDALSAAPLTKSGSDFTPVLLTPRDLLRNEVAAELSRRLAPGSTVFLMGGTAALSDAVAGGVTTAGFEVQRVAGKDRFETAAALARRLVDPGQKLSEIILATGKNFPDALAVSPYAAARRIPILLVTDSAVPRPTQDFLDEHADSSTTVDIIGGTAVAAPPTPPPNGYTVRRVNGLDRFGTAAEVAKQLWGRLTGGRNDNLSLARGDQLGGGADALSGAPLAASATAPLLLTFPTFLPDNTLAYMNRQGYDRPLRPARSFIFGGTVAVNDATAAAWSNLLNGMQVVSAKSSTFRDVVNGASTAGAATPTPGCSGGVVTQTFSLTLQGDKPGALNVVADFCPDGETSMVLPGTTVTYKPTGATTPLTGKVTGGIEGGPPSPPATSRPVTIDFVLDSANLVGHLSLTNPASRAGDVADGLLVLVGVAPHQGLEGTFSGFPATGCGTVSFSGSIGPNAATPTTFEACKAGGASGAIWRIGRGSVGGELPGNVVSGLRRDKSLGLQLRTDKGLIDVSATLDAADKTAADKSPALVQLLPESDPTVAFTATPGGTETTPAGCAGLFTERDLTVGVVDGPPVTSFPGTLAVNGLRECATMLDGTTAATVGVVEPTIGTPDPADPNARPVVFTTTDGSFRGRILSGTYLQSGTGPSATRDYALTLLLEENNRAAGGTADAPSVSFTVLRLAVNGVPVVGGPGTGPVTFSR